MRQLKASGFIKDFGAICYAIYTDSDSCFNCSTAPTSAKNSHERVWPSEAIGVQLSYRKMTLLTPLNTSDTGKRVSTFVSTLAYFEGLKFRIRLYYRVETKWSG